MPDPTAPVFDDRARRATKVAAFVTFAGPPIGAAAYLALIAVHSFATAAPDQSSTFELQTAVTIGGLIILFTYLFGGLPAFFSGLALARHVYVGGGPVTAMRAIVTAVVGTLLASVVLRAILMLGGPRLPSIVFAMLPSALFSAIITLFLMRRLGLIQRS